MLEELVAPFVLSLFRLEYWERKPLHLQRQVPTWYRTLPSIDELDSIVAGSVVDELRLVRGAAYVPVKVGHYGRPHLPSVYHAYADGWTVVVNALHLRLASIAEIAAGLAHDFSASVQANLYLTPAGSQGLDPHADGHDVFILQLEGCKSWKIYSPHFELPLDNTAAPKRLDDPVLQAQTEAGHLLYIPRGFIHEAKASTHTSLHLTIGVHTVRWIDLIKAGFSEVAEQDIRLRRTIPSLEVDDDLAIEEVAETLALLLKAADGREMALKSLNRVRAEQHRINSFSPQPHFKVLDRAATLSLDGIVAVRLGQHPCVVREQDHARIEFGGRSIKAPLEAAEALSFICAQRQFRVGALPDVLTDQSKIVLIRRLIREGLLTVGEPDAD